MDRHTNRSAAFGELLAMTKGSNLSVTEISNYLIQAKRPLFLMGGGARQLETLSIVDWINSSGIPVAVTWSGTNLCGKLKNYCGVVGQFGRPAANSALHESDFAIALGSRLPNTVTGANKSLLMNKIVHVDVDPQELRLSRDSIGSHSILSDSEVFLNNLSKELKSSDLMSSDRWRAWRNLLTDRQTSEMSALQGAQGKTPAGLANSHSAVSAFLRDAKADDVLVIDGGGTALYSGFQAAPLDRFHRVVSLNAISSMGTAPGQMVGSLKATSSGRVIGLIGDGSFVMALNALPSISSEPRALLIVISNGGYLAIRHTQERFLGRRFLGTWTGDSEKLPSVRELAGSLGFNYVKYSESDTPGIQSVMDRFKETSKATVLEIFTDVQQPPLWSTSSRLDPQTRRVSPLPLSSMDYLGKESND